IATFKRMNKENEMAGPSEADERLSKIILKACSYEPRYRYQSAEEMKNDLQDYKKMSKKRSMQYKDIGTTDLDVKMEKIIKDTIKKHEAWIERLCKENEVNSNCFVKNSHGFIEIVTCFYKENDENLEKIKQSI